MTTNSRPVLVVENDPFLRIIQIALDPSTSKERIEAFAEFFEHDLPDFDGYLQEVRDASAGLYPAEVRLVDSQEELLEALNGADAVVVESLQVGEAELATADKVRVVQKFGTILRNIDTNALEAHGVALRTQRRRANIACAEHTLAMLLELAKKFNRIGGLISFEQLQAAGYSPRLWNRTHTATSGWARVSGIKMLYESTFGIIGMGEIGRELALRALPFGMKLLYTQRTPMSPEDEQRYGVEYAPLPELLAASDWVSVQLPGNTSTENYLNRAEIAQMKPGAVLINTSRPQIINRDAVLEALRSGRLGGFALDTIYEVPGRSDDELLGFDNVFITPWTAAQPRFNALNDLREVITGIGAALR
ncbi:MAG: NAD(P)-dependent oxidoreductase [Dehalococcoidia bacterium]